MQYEGSGVKNRGLTEKKMKSMESFPKKVRIVEVGPRDGLQNEKNIVETSDKENFIRLLAKAGNQTIEPASFVRADLMPQMADGYELYNSIKDLNDSVDLSCLVPNMKGLEKAIECGVKEIAVFTAASESFNQKNINATISKSFERIAPVAKKAIDGGIKVRGYVSTAFGCPYEGHIDPKVVLDVSDRLRDLGCYEISIGDTIGCGTPLSVKRVLDKFKKFDDLAMHFHDTRGMAISNILTSLEYGIDVYDSSSGGLGGCPYAKGATGNVGTEDLLYLFNSLGIETGVDLEKQVVASKFILGVLGKKTTSKFLQAYINGEGELYLP